MVGWGVVGCSDIVERRAAEAIRQQPLSRLVAFHSRQRERAEAFAARFGADTAHDDLERLLGDPRIDVVYVATEVNRHAELTIAAARAGKHVLVEKPMAVTVAECRDMIAAAERAGVRLAVAYYARFLEKAIAIKRVIDEGRLGTVVRATVTQLGTVRHDPSSARYWRVSGQGGGNVLADVGSHRIDMLVYWLGRPVRVAGLADRLSMPYPAADTETALAQLESGVHVTVLASANVPRGAFPTAGPGNPSGPSSIAVYGTEGALLTDPWSGAPIEIVGATETAAGNDAAPIQCTLPANLHGPLMDEFATAIAAGRAPRFSGVDGMWATAVIAGALESAQTGRFVEIAS
jgi:predicted dehydrogenase